ncbi:MAG: sulfatase-like hydrolase/transferase [Planctomycetota bacterium]|jgi:arylsulfatase A-like enzyme|nr:sulfatase-like hydrolase/transferase [Planctomycetota bacterium]
MLRDRIFAVFLGNLLLCSLVAIWFSIRKRPFGVSFLGGAAVGISGVCFSPWLGLLTLALFLLVANRVGSEFELPLRPLRVFGVLSLTTPLIALWANPSTAPVPTSPVPELISDYSEQPPAKGMDIVLIVADTLRADAILAPGVRTPNLDRLRASGSWSRAATAPCNQTIPSHLSLLTGLEPEKIGMRNNLSSWPSKEVLEDRWDMVSLAQRFQNAGWRTAGIAGNALLSKVPEGAHPISDGFELWDGLHRELPWWKFSSWKKERTWLGWITPSGKIDGAVNVLLRFLLQPNYLRFSRLHKGLSETTTQHALSVHRQLVQSERPFFLFINFMDVHAPYLPNDSVSPKTEYDMRLQLRRKGEEGLEDEELSNQLQHLYHLELEKFDLQLGLILEGLESTGRPFTLLFTGDHGEMFGEHGFVEHSSSLFENEITVPFVLFGHGVPEGVEIAGQVRLVDGSRTLAQLAGVEAEGMDGFNLLAPTGRPPSPSLSLMSDACSMRHGRWKTIFQLNTKTIPYEIQSVSLFDLQSNPEETNDVAEENPEIVEFFISALRPRLERDLLPSLEERTLSWREKQLLEDMGYRDDAEE